ncbi:MAG: hypothetical protein M1820_009192, partial [Bogoriella megaspora]
MEKTIAASSINIIDNANLDRIEKPTMNANKANNEAPKLMVEHLENSGNSPSEHGVRIVRIEEYKQAAMTLAEAFSEDEVAMYFIDTPDRQHWTKEQKWNLHVQILEYVTYAHCLKGLVTTAGEDYGCVALWCLTHTPRPGDMNRMPPGKNMDDYLTIFRSGLWRLFYQLSAEGKKRFFTEFLPLLHDTKAGILGPRDDDSWYLVYLGTKEAARGQGLARKVVERVTQLADAQKKVCYLESSNEKNPAIYKKWGFTLARKIHLQRAAKNVELDIMVREPKPTTVEPVKAMEDDEDIRAAVEA